MHVLLKNDMVFSILVHACRSVMKLPTPSWMKLSSRLHRKRQENFFYVSHPLPVSLLNHLRNSCMARPEGDRPGIAGKKMDADDWKSGPYTISHGLF